MKKSVSFLKIAGIGVYVHWTFPLLILYIVYTNLRAGLDPVQIGWSVFFALTLFVCVILHEFGHALTAKKYGIRTEDITLYPIGGVARLQRIPEKPSQELMVTLAGPMVNVMIVVVLLPFILGLDLVRHLGENPAVISPDNFVINLAILNVWLALFNMIPAFPMDGGRILRALLAMRTSRLRATTIASNVGKLLSIGFIIAGFYYNPFLIFIGVFIILGAQSELEVVRKKELSSGLTARDAMMSQWSELDAASTLAEAVSRLLSSESKSFMVKQDDAYIGTLDRDGIIKALRTKNDEVLVSEICNQQVSFADPTTPLEEVFNRFQMDRISLVAVIENGTLVGVIDMENVAELFMVLQAKLVKK
jgi:Zn-dependent protease